MVNAHEIPDKCFRALTCAAISGAKYTIRSGNYRQVLDELAFAKNKGHVLWESLELLCGVDVENVRSQLIAYAYQRIESFERKLNPNPKQLKLFEFKTYERNKI